MVWHICFYAGYVRGRAINRRIWEKIDITVKSFDGKTKYKSYQECCASNDYEAAHKYLTEMENIDEEKHDYYHGKTVKEEKVAEAKNIFSSRKLFFC